MGWFDDQLRYRKEKDNDQFSDAIGAIAGAVMGKRLTEALNKREIAQSAMDEILRFYHCKPRTDELPPQIQTLEEQLDYRMRPFGIMRRTVTLDKGWYHHAVGAMLGTLASDGTPVALLPGKVYGYTFMNLSTRQCVKLNRKTEKLLDPEALCFYQPLPLKQLTMMDLLKFMLQQFSVSDIVLYVGMTAITTLIGLLSPLFTKWLFGTVLASGSTRVLLALAAFMVSYSICNLCVSAFRSLVNNRVGIKQNIAVQAAVMSRMLSLPPRFFRDYAPGELTQRSSYVQSLCAIMMSTIGNTAMTSLFSLVYVGQVFTFAPSLVVPSLLVTLVTVGFSLLTTFMQMKISREKMLLSSKTSGMTYSMITGIQKIKLAGAEKRAFARWANQYAKEATLDYNPPTFIKLNGTISLALSLAGTLLMYYIAIQSGISVADYYAFSSAYGMIAGAFSSLASIATTIANIRPTLEMAKPIMETAPETADDKEIVSSLRGGIELNHISFRYSDDMPNVIDDLSLKIKPGDYIAIVGKTGCGKSTLLRLLLGFEKPQKGAVYYDRYDLSRVDLRSIRQKIGVVMQDGKLFTGDIFSNIVISAPSLTLNDAWKVAETACIADDIRQMPMGMNTLISEGQGGISGGQRQRLMIARAIAPNPRILMFDEATSALDNVTQKKISEAIDGLKCTRIVIAHRLSTIRHCGRIIVLDKGKIVEDGAYDELIAQNGFFADLVARQRLDAQDE